MSEYLVCISDWRFVVCFFFKQRTANEMRISDWSSDVCSSDLAEAEQACNAVGEAFGLADVEAARHLESRRRRVVDHDRQHGVAVGLGDQPVETYRAIFGPAIGPAFGNLGLPGNREAFAVTLKGQQIGRASCRERVCQYVSISVGAA